MAAPAPLRARALAVGGLDCVRAEPDLVLTAEEVEQYADPLRAVHAGAQPELAAQRPGENAHPSSGPQPA